MSRVRRSSPPRSLPPPSAPLPRRRAVHLPVDTSFRRRPLTLPSFRRPYPRSQNARHRGTALRRRRLNPSADEAARAAVEAVDAATRISRRAAAAGHACRGLAGAAVRSMFAVRNVCERDLPISCSPRAGKSRERDRNQSHRGRVASEPCFSFCRRSISSGISGIAHFPEWGGSSMCRPSIQHSHCKPGAPTTAQVSSAAATNGPNSKNTYPPWP